MNIEPVISDTDIEKAARLGNERFRQLMKDLYDAVSNDGKKIMLSVLREYGSRPTEH